MKKISILPSLITLGNALCGILAIAYAADALLYSSAPGNPDPNIFSNRITNAAWLIFLAMVFDALDGKIARMTNLTSDFGGQLDSLCDAISFGVAPAILAKVMLDHESIFSGMPPHPKLVFWAAVPFALGAILRLARFNVENEHGDEAHEHFKGLPSPAAAGVVAVCVLLFYDFGDSWGAKQLQLIFPSFDPHIVTHSIRFLLPFMLPVLGLLMVSRVRYIHFMNYVFKERKAFPFLIYALFLLILAAVEFETALALAFVGFAFSGPIIWIVKKVAGRKVPPVLDDEDERESPVT